VAATLESLVCAAQRGEIDAFGLLVERFQRMACAVAYATVGDIHLAEDAAQEAFIEAFQCLPSLREPAAFPAWFRRIVHKRADRLVRGRRLELLPIEAAGATPSALPGPAQVSEMQELRRAMLDAVATLPEPERLLVSLFHLAGYSQREVAAITEIPEPLVKKRLFRARQALRRQIESHMPELFEGQIAERGAFARAVQFFIAVRASDHAQVQRMLSVCPALINERERWDEEHARRSHLPVVGSFTALHRAAFQGDLELAELLLRRGARPDATTKIGHTPLHTAVLVDHPPIVERLLDAGADPNAPTDRGQTPLHWAVIRARPWMIRRLLAAGADPSARDAEGRAPLDWAALRGADLEQLLTSKGGHHD
jgi:RNA polymerase sigma factor (sigma-70 family)